MAADERRQLRPAGGDVFVIFQELPPGRDGLGIALRGGQTFRTLRELAEVFAECLEDRLKLLRPRGRQDRIQIPHQSKFRHANTFRLAGLGEFVIGAVSFYASHQPAYADRSPLLFDLEDGFDFHAGAGGEGGEAQGAAGVVAVAFLAEDFVQEVRGPVDDQVLIGEVRGGIHAAQRV